MAWPSPDGAFPVSVDYAARDERGVKDPVAAPIEIGTLRDQKFGLDRRISSRRNISLSLPRSVALFALLSATLTAKAEPPRPPTITIEADHFELQIAHDRAVFRGTVEASQGNYTFRTEQLTLHLDQITGGREGTSSEAAGGRALGHRYSLSAKRLEYDLASDTISGIGDSELRRGLELIRADRLNFSVSQQLAYALPEAGGRVLVRFYANPDMPIFPGVASTASAAGE